VVISSVLVHLMSIAIDESPFMSHVQGRRLWDARKVVCLASTMAPTVSCLAWLTAGALLGQSAGFQPVPSTHIIR
jgi:hypothetical protein